MSLRLGARFGSMFREVTSPPSSRPGAKVAKLRSARRPHRETSTRAHVTSFTPDRGRAVTYTIGELVMEAYARASRVTSDPEIEAILATRLLAAWLARSTLSSTRPSAAREAEAAPVRQAAGRQEPREIRRSRTARTVRRAGFVSAVHVHRAVA
jgi:hypothetical protein